MTMKTNLPPLPPDNISRRMQRQGGEEPGEKIKACHCHVHGVRQTRMGCALRGHMREPSSSGLDACVVWLQEGREGSSTPAKSETGYQGNYT